MMHRNGGRGSMRGRPSPYDRPMRGPGPRGGSGPMGGGPRGRRGGFNNGLFSLKFVICIEFECS